MWRVPWVAPASRSTGGSLNTGSIRPIFDVRACELLCHELPRAGHVKSLLARLLFDRTVAYTVGAAHEPDLHLAGRRVVKDQVRRVIVVDEPCIDELPRAGHIKSLLGGLLFDRVVAYTVGAAHEPD